MGTVTDSAALGSGAGGGLPKGALRPRRRRQRRGDTRRLRRRYRCHGVLHSRLGLLHHLVCAAGKARLRRRVRAAVAQVSPLAGGPPLQEVGVREPHAESHRSGGPRREVLRHPGGPGQGAWDGPPTPAARLHGGRRPEVDAQGVAVAMGAGDDVGRRERCRRRRREVHWVKAGDVAIAVEGEGGALWVEVAESVDVIGEGVVEEH